MEFAENIPGSILDEIALEGLEGITFSSLCCFTYVNLYLSEITSIFYVQLYYSIVDKIEVKKEFPTCVRRAI